MAVIAGDSGLREIAAGVDALYLSGQAQVPGSLLERLAVARAEAKEAGPVPFLFGGQEFRLLDRGWGRYLYCLSGELGRIGITPGEALPALRFQPLALLLHSLGPSDVVALCEDLAVAECGRVALSVARVDVFADWQGWEFRHSLALDFVCRAKDRTTYESGERCTGYSFGSRKGNGFFGRLYDKTEEIRTTGHDWWHDVWGPRYNPAEDVHRVEFQIGREGLRSMQIKTPEEVLGATGDLWRYCTHEWLTLRTPTADATRHRWPMTPEWLTVQASSLSHDLVGLARLKDGGRSGALRLLMPGLNGYLASVGAVLGIDSVAEALEAAAPHLEAYEVTSGRPFASRVQEKRNQTVGSGS
jgi:hypothetical protein